MTMQRRRRQWTTVQPSTVTLNDSNTPSFLASDLLVNLASDNDYGGHTVARIIGYVSFVAAAESSPSLEAGRISAGITIVSERLTTASAGDAQIPDPSVTSTYEADWWWRWTTPTIFTDPNNQPASQAWPFFPSTETAIAIDIRSQRKLRSGERLSLIVAQTGWTTVHEPLVNGWARSLVLLP